METSILHEPNNISAEYYSLLVSLMAKMSKADGKVLDIENHAALAVLQSSLQSDAEVQNAAEEQYRKIIARSDTEAISNAERAQLQLLAPNEKLFLIRTLAGIAACDGSVHANENAILNELTEILQASKEA